MSFEFELAPLTPPGEFTAADFAEMRAWWDTHPTAVAPDGSLVVFPNDEVRAFRLERQRRHPGRNDYLSSFISFEPHCVQLSIVGDKVTDRWFHDFALWVQQRWAAELQYFGDPVPATDILAASEDDD